MLAGPGATRRLALDDQRRVVVGSVAASALLGLGLAAALRDGSPSMPVIVAGGMGALAVLGLALASDAAVALGFALFGIVTVEPAPADGVFAILIALAILTGTFELRRIPFAVLALLGTFLILNLLSATQAIDFSATARFLGITLYLVAFGVWLAQHVRSVSITRSVAHVYVLGAACFAALASLALFVPIPGHTLLTTADGLRAKGLFKDPNVFGPFLVPAALILIEEIVRPRLVRWAVPIKWAVLSTLVAGILLSYSRAAWLNLVVGLLVMLIVLLLQPGGSRTATVFLLVSASLAVVLVAIVSVSGSGSFVSERTRFHQYDTERFGAQASGVRVADQHPLGIGPGQIDVKEQISSHSIYVRAMSEQGWLGFIVIDALLLATLMLACRNAVVGADTWGIGSAALLGAWCGILSNSAFVDTLHWRHLWFVAALIWAGATRGNHARYLEGAAVTSPSGR